jgi:hypothetical protein
MRHFSRNASLSLPHAALVNFQVQSLRSLSKQQGIMAKAKTIGVADDGAETHGLNVVIRRAVRSAPEMRAASGDAP